MYSMHHFLFALGLLHVVGCETLWKDTTPQTPQPYAIKKGHGIAIGSGDTWNTFPVTGNSSGKAFTLMNTNGPGTWNASGFFPHVHRKTYENFYSSKGRVQLWGQNANSYHANTSIQTTRILSQGDFGAIPTNTIHTFTLLEPDTQLTGVLVPGGFEEFFFAMAQYPGNDPAGFLNSSNLASWDVYPQLEFIPRGDAVNGKAGPGNWYDGPNVLPNNDDNPIWIAKNYGSKWLNAEAGYYQIIAPLVTGVQTRNLFAQGHVTMSMKTENVTAPRMTSLHATALMLEEGQLAVTVDGFKTAHLIDGDVVFVPPNTTFTYYAEVEFTKFMYVSGGNNGLDKILIRNAIVWDSAFYPRDGQKSPPTAVRI